MNRQRPLITDSGGFQASTGKAHLAIHLLPACPPAHLPARLPLVRYRYRMRGFVYIILTLMIHLSISCSAGLFPGLWQRARGGQLPEARQRQEPAQAGAQPCGESD
jgi:hypothetical protein